MINMVASDGSLIKAYQEAMENGNIALAQNYYSQITNANQKFIDATKMNTLMDTCVALERFYKTDIQPYIVNKQSEWQGIINQFSYKNVYSEDVQYAVNNFVLYNFNGINFLYICINTPPTAGITPTNTTYWRQLTIQGVKGDSGDGLSFLYAWNSGTDYNLQDLVTFDNILWGCIQPNSNQQPYEGSPYWKKAGSIQQIIYPLQPNAPTGQSIGELWFQTL